MTSLTAASAPQAPRTQLVAAVVRVLTLSPADGVSCYGGFLGKHKLTDALEVIGSAAGVLSSRIVDTRKSTLRNVGEGLGRYGGGGEGQSSNGVLHVDGLWFVNLDITCWRSLLDADSWERENGIKRIGQVGRSSWLKSKPRSRHTKIKSTTKPTS